MKRVLLTALLAAGSWGIIGCERDDGADGAGTGGRGDTGMTGSGS